MLPGDLTRRDAEGLLIFKPVGCYVVRTCHTRPGYALTYRARDCCRHYRISAVRVLPLDEA
jgi:hypothetical protein